MLEPLKGVVRSILRNYAEPWPPDITDQVFLAIERDPGRCRIYWGLVADLDEQGKRGQQTVNQYIGKTVKQLTTRVNRGRSDSPASSLIQTYEKH